MVSSGSHSVKIDLSESAKRCGNCEFCGRYEISLYSADMTRLQNAAKEILNAKPGGAFLRSEYVIDVLVVFERLHNEKVYCRQERCWVNLLEPACSLWQPRDIQTISDMSQPNSSCKGGKFCDQCFLGRLSNHK